MQTQEQIENLVIMSYFAKDQSFYYLPQTFLSYDIKLQTFQIKLKIIQIYIYGLIDIYVCVWYKEILLRYNKIIMSNIFERT